MTKEESDLLKQILQASPDPLTIPWIDERMILINSLRKQGLVTLYDMGQRGQGASRWATTAKGRKIAGGNPPTLTTRDVVLLLGLLLPISAFILVQTVASIDRARNTYISTWPDVRCEMDYEGINVTEYADGKMVQFVRSATLVSTRIEVVLIPTSTPTHPLIKVEAIRRPLPWAWLVPWSCTRMTETRTAEETSQ